MKRKLLELADLAQAGGMPEEARTLRNAADRIDELETIVAKFPKMADGVPITPNMNIWLVDDEGIRMVPYLRLDDFEWADCEERCYNSLEKAETAMAEREAL